MGRWKVNSTPYECQMKCDLGVITGHNNEDDAGYVVLASAHNANCDAYDARIAELEAEVDRLNREIQAMYDHDDTARAALEGE